MQRKEKLKMEIVRNEVNERARVLKLMS